jgi:hypothetical protein
MGYPQLRKGKQNIMLFACSPFRSWPAVDFAVFRWQLRAFLAFTHIEWRKGVREQVIAALKPCPHPLPAPPPSLTNPTVSPFHCSNAQQVKGTGQGGAVQWQRRELRVNDRGLVFWGSMIEVFQAGWPTQVPGRLYKHSGTDDCCLGIFSSLTVQAELWCLRLHLAMINHLTWSQWKPRRKSAGIGVPPNSKVTWYDVSRVSGSFYSEVGMNGVDPTLWKTSY